MSRILVIDDELDILILVKKVLEKDGHLVTTAQSPDKVQLTRLNHYDLILLDVMMPGTDGFSFLPKSARYC